MKFQFRLPAVLLLAGTLAGCAVPSAIPVGTSADELQQRLGKPTEIYRTAQGELWDYAYGPEGLQTWRFEIDRNRKVGGATQLLTQERLYRVMPGVSTADDVTMLLGKPRDISHLAGEAVWEWRVAIPPEVGVFLVRFGPDGKASGYNVLEDIKSDDAVP
jgi:outer membrane protein assembly factor BamE (lipoprotein component of BamABCDE complex)